MGPTPPCCKRGSVLKSRLEKERKTHGKEDPLKHLAVVSWLFRDIELKLVFSKYMYIVDAVYALGIGIERPVEN